VISRRANGGRLEDMGYLPNTSVRPRIPRGRRSTRLRTGLLTRVGGIHGRFIREQLVREGVDVGVSSLIRTPDCLVILEYAIVRPFAAFYRENARYGAVRAGSRRRVRLAARAH